MVWPNVDRSTSHSTFTAVSTQNSRFSTTIAGFTQISSLLHLISNFQSSFHFEFNILILGSDFYLVPTFLTFLKEYRLLLQVSSVLHWFPISKAVFTSNSIFWYTVSTFTSFLTNLTFLKKHRLLLQVSLEFPQFCIHLQSSFHFEFNILILGFDFYLFLTFLKEYRLLLQVSSVLHWFPISKAVFTSNSIFWYTVSTFTLFLTNLIFLKDYRLLLQVSREFPQFYIHSQSSFHFEFNILILGFDFHLFSDEFDIFGRLSTTIASFTWISSVLHLFTKQFSLRMQYFDTQFRLSHLFRRIWHFWKTIDHCC